MFDIIDQFKNWNKKILTDKDIIKEQQKEQHKLDKIKNENRKEEKIIILCGASCVGKDTLLNILKEEYNLNTLISYTTRPKRINETDGKDYYFIKKSKFINMIENNEFIEYKRYVASKVIESNKKEKKEVWFYGTSKEEFEKTKNKICILDVSGIEKIKKYYGSHNMIVIYIHSEDELRTKRAKNRKDFNEEKWEKRNQFDKQIFTKDFIKNEVNFIITNNNDKEYLTAQAEKIMKSYGFEKYKIN